MEHRYTIAPATRQHSASITLLVPSRHTGPACRAQLFTPMVFGAASPLRKQAEGTA